MKTYLPIATAGMLLVALAGCEVAPEASYPIVTGADCAGLVDTETEHVVADTFVVIEFDAADGYGSGTITHHDLFGTNPGLLEIDGTPLPVDMALEIEGPVLWADDEHAFVTVEFEPGPEVPEEYRIDLVGTIEVETGRLDGTFLDVEKSMGCGSAMVISEE